MNLPPSLRSCAATGAGAVVTGSCSRSSGAAAGNTATATTSTPNSKQVSFRERIDRIAVDGTVEHATLQKMHTYDFDGPSPCLASLDFDFGLCRIADLTMGSFDSHGSGGSGGSVTSIGVCSSSSSVGEVVLVEPPEEVMLVASYKKFAPRSQLKYIAAKTSSV